jgi:hypothetical protein
MPAQEAAHGYRTGTSMNQRIHELQSELRRLKKAERKEKGKRLGHAEKKSGQAYTDGEHEYLADPVAFTKRRIEIFRNAGGEVTWFDEADPWSVEEIRPANCQGCAETHLVGWNEGHYHHNCPLEKKCDAAACGLFVCPTSHREIHGRVIRSDRAERRLA